jgi:dipeptidyl aminopeptidase/acylaminoacyl peptidase
VVEPQTAGVTIADPSFLSDGRHFLYYAGGSSSANGIYLGALDTFETRRLTSSDVGNGAVYASRQLVFIRQGVLLAQSFDLASLQLSGDPVPVVDRVAINAALSASEAGLIAYRTGSATQGMYIARRLVWLDRSGKELGNVGDPIEIGTLLSLSADSRYLAVDARGSGRTANVWQLETERGVRSRLTLHAPPVNDISPVWSPDGNNIAFSSNAKGEYDLYRKSLTGQGVETLLLATPHLKTASDWSADGRFLLYSELDPKTGVDIWALSLEGGSPLEIVRTNFNEGQAQFSPDGKWIAFASDKSGRFEVYVQPYPLAQGREQLISTGGGAQPRWSNDAKELFYIALDEQLMAAAISPAPDGRSVAAGRPVPLFQTHIGGALQGGAQHLYVVSRDGRRFLMAKVAQEPIASPITVILNWKK